MSYSFDAIEGRYQSYNSEPCALEKQLQMSHFGIGNVAVRLSFLDLPTNEESTNRFSSECQGEGNVFCINIGNDLRVYSQEHANPSPDHRLCGSTPAQLRFKAPPTSHCFRRINDRALDSQLLIGLANGEVKLIDPLKEDPNKIFNEGKSIDESPVTCVSWVPHSPNQFLVGHSSGCMYLYDETLSPLSAPAYSLFKQSVGFSVYTCKTKSTRNPLYRWVLGSHIGITGNGLTKHSSKISPNNNYLNGFVGAKANDTSESDSSGHNRSSLLTSLFEENNVSINQFSFSPCGRFLAIVTEDGYLRVIEYHEMELYGFMRSYFGGLLCVDWSPDSLYVVTGGQDDLITVWSVAHRAVICRGQGHKSWVSMVRFDPFLCPKDEDGSADNQPTNTSHSLSLSASSENMSKDLPVCASPDTLCGGNSLRTYRLGSVGHDTMLCLWDLTDDIIRQGETFIQTTTSSLGSGFGNITCDTSFPVPPSSEDVLHSNSSGSAVNENSSIPVPSPQSVDNGSSASSAFSSPPIRNRRTFMGFVENRTQNKRKSTNVNSTPSSGPPSRGSTSDKSKSIFTLPRGFHWTYPNSTNNKADSHLRSTRSAASDKLNRSTSNSVKTCSLGCLSQVKWMVCLTENNILGSPVCPRINDVPMLEPLVCTRILKDRVTDLVFRRDTIHIVDQQGLFLAWQRPTELLPSECMDL